MGREAINSIIEGLEQNRTLKDLDITGIFIPGLHFILRILLIDFIPSENNIQSEIVSYVQSLTLANKSSSDL